MFSGGGLTLGEVLGSSPQKHSGTFPNFFGEAYFTWSPPKHSGTLLTLGETLGSSPQKHSGVFPKFFLGGWLLWKSSEAVPKNIRKRAPIFFFREADFGRNPQKHLGTFLNFFGEADFRWNPRKHPQKHSGTFPNFFLGRLTLREILGSSPQKHSGTFPNFFGESDFRWSPRKQSPKTLGNVPEFSRSSEITCQTSFSSSENLISAGEIRLVAHFLLFIAFPSSDSRFLIKSDDFGKCFSRLIRDCESDKKIVWSDDFAIVWLMSPIAPVCACFIRSHRSSVQKAWRPASFLPIPFCCTKPVTLHTGHVSKC